MFSHQRGHSGISLEAANYNKTEVSIVRTEANRLCYAFNNVHHSRSVIMAFYLRCATFATGSTVHHKLDITSKPSLSTQCPSPRPPPQFPPSVSRSSSHCYHIGRGLKVTSSESEVRGLGSEDEGQPEVV